MKLLLVEDVEGLGKTGEVVEVRPGFGRNYLVPKRLAVVPSDGALREFQLRQKKRVKINKKLVEDASKIREEIEKIPFVNIEHRANEEGVLYGAVSPSMITEALLDYGIKLEPKLVVLKEHIKKIGEYEVSINLFKEVTSKLNVKIVATQEVKTTEEEQTEKPPEES